jgi:S1-C subfamily serine protease
MPRLPLLRVIFSLSLCWGCINNTAPAQISNVASQQKINKNVAEAIDHIRLSVVQIQVLLQYKYLNPGAPAFSNTIPLGSGFVADAKGHIITALHIVNDIASLPGRAIASPSPNGPIDAASIKTTIFVGFQMTRSFHDASVGPPSPTGPWNSFGNFTLLEATVSRRSTTGDAALLAIAPSEMARLPKETWGPPEDKATVRAMLPKTPVFDKRLSVEGEMIAVSGFPLALPVMVTNVGWIGSEYIMLPDNLKPKGHNGIEYVQIGSLQINHGNSGGPVYRVKDGAVIGIAVAYLNAPAENVTVHIENSNYSGQANINSGLCLIVPIKEALDLLPAQ